MYVVVDTDTNRIVIQSTVYMGHGMRSAGTQVSTYDKGQAAIKADACNTELNTTNRFAVFQLELM